MSRLVALLAMCGCGQATELSRQLRVTGTSPDGGSMAIPVSTTFVVTFSEPLDASTVDDDSVALGDGKGGDVAGVLTYEPGGATIVFDPDDDLASDSDYTLSVSSTLRGENSDAIGGTALFDYHTEWIDPDTGTPPDDTGDSGGPTDTAPPVWFAPDHFAVFYMAGVYAGQPSEVWIDATTTALPELVVALLEGDDPTQAKDTERACQLVFDLESDVAVAVQSGTISWSVAWGVSLSRSFVAARGRCDEMDPAVWTDDPVAALGWTSWTFGFEPLDPAMEPLLEERFATSWPTVRPFLGTTWIDTGVDLPVAMGFTWSYAIDGDRNVVRDTEGAVVPQGLEGTTALPNGWYPTEPALALPLPLPG
jgi:hypothetical protein